MNTNDIFISKLSIVSKVEDNASHFCALEFKNIRYVLVRINNYKHICKDLITDETYLFNELGGYSVGNICLNPNYIRSFNSVVGNKKKHVSKKKIISMYNSIERYK